MYARRCLVVVVALLALGACTPGSPAPVPSASPSAPAPSAGPPSSSSPASPAGSAPAPATSPSEPLGLTLYGVAHPGEQPGCILLTATDNRVYLLLGGDRQLIAAGGQLAVTGMIVPGLLNSQCRDGIPFQVTSVRPD